MIRRFAALITIAAFCIACGSPLENAVGTVVAQARLDDPQAEVTYAENRELLESTEATPLWIEVLQNDESPKAKRWAATALGNIGDPSALPVLADALSSPNRDVRDAASNAIRQYEAADAAEALAGALETGNRDAKATALGELSRLETHGPDTVAAVAEVATSGDELVATSAVNLLGDIGSDEAIAALAAVIGDPAQPMRLRSHALDMLARIDSPKVGETARGLVEILEAEEGAEGLVAKARPLG